MMLPHEKKDATGAPSSTVSTATEAPMKRRRQPSRFVRARRETIDIAKFIDAHGGKLGTFRYGTVPAPLRRGSYGIIDPTVVT